MIISLKVFLFLVLLENCSLYDYLVSYLRVVRCQSVIILVINKSESRFAVVRFCNYSYDYTPNRTPLTLYPVWINKIIFAHHITWNGKLLAPHNAATHKQVHKHICTTYMSCEAGRKRANNININNIEKVGRLSQSNSSLCFASVSLELHFLTTIVR